MTDSFSSRLKSELWQKSDAIQRDCCKRSFLSAVFAFRAADLAQALEIPLPDANAAGAFCTLCRRKSLSAKTQHDHRVIVKKDEAFSRFVRASGIGEELSGDPVFLCGDCFGHYLRGVFLCCGTLADPEKSHHLSLFTKARTAHIRALIAEHGDLDLKISTRRNVPYLYLKSLSQIEDFLTLIGAGHVTMELLNSDLEHSMRALVNRQNNFDTANLSRTLEWNRKALDSIERLKATGRYDALPPALKAVARAKVRYPNDTLQKLGTRLKPRLSKSGVYHRLKKLIDLARE